MKNDNISEGWLVFNYASGPEDSDEVAEWKEKHPNHENEITEYLNTLKEGEDYFNIGEDNMCGGYSYLMFKERDKAEKFASLIPEVQAGEEEVRRRYYFNFGEIISSAEDEDATITNDIRELLMDYGADFEELTMYHYGTDFLSSEYSERGKLDLLNTIECFRSGVESLLNNE